MSKDGEKFAVDLEVAKMSMLVVNTLDEDEEDDDDEEEDTDIYVPNVNGPVLEKVIEFCNHYKNVEEMTTIETPLVSSKIDDVVQEWYVEFCKVSENMLFEYLAAANFMDIKPLLDLSCFAVTILLKGKSSSEIEQLFNLRKETQLESES